MKLKSLFIPSLLCIASLQAPAAVIQTPSTNATAYNFYTVSTTDLLQQTGVVTTTTGYTPFVGSGYTFGQPNPVLTNGSAGGISTAAANYSTSLVFEGGAGVNVANHWSVTYDLDLTGASLGFDLTEINTFSGWSDRAGQVYNVYYSVVGSGTYSLLTSVSEQTALNGSRKVAITDGTGILASGVDSIRFEMNSGSANGHVYREIDVMGVAAVPEPSAALLGSLGLLALIRRRR
jgi:hypothetical protein